MALKSKKQRKQSIVKESYDDLVNAYLKTYLIEMDVRMDPREGFNDDPFVDPTEDMSGGVELTPEEMRKIVAAEVGEEQALTMSDQDIEYFYDYHFGEPEDVSELEKNILALQPNNDEENEGVVGEDDEQEQLEFNTWLKQKFKDRPEFLKNLAYDQDMVMDLFHDFRQEKSQNQPAEEDYEEECEDNCQCDRCKGNNGEKMLNFYGFTK
jgi:hypothetical protein